MKKHGFGEGSLNKEVRDGHYHDARGHGHRLGGEHGSHKSVKGYPLTERHKTIEPYEPKGDRFR